MHKKRVLLFLSLASMAAVIGYWFFALPSYDPARVEPRLLALKTPYRSVQPAYYLGGSGICMEIVDRDGKYEQFFIPSRADDPPADRYTHVYVGALHAKKFGAVEIKDPEHTRRMLVRILANAPRADIYDDFCLMKLGRRPADYVAFLIRRFTEGPPTPWATRNPAPLPFHSPAPPAAAP